MKLIKILLISVFIIITLSQNVFATGGLNEILGTASGWIDDGLGNAGYGLDTEILAKGSKNLYYIFIAVAVGVAIIVGSILGIRYMTAGLDKKAEVKESLFPYLVSCIVVFGSVGIWKLTVNVLKLLL